MDAWIRFVVVGSEKLPEMEAAVEKVLATEGEKLIVVDGKHFAGSGRDVPGIPLHTLRALLAAVTCRDAENNAKFLMNDSIFIISDGRNMKTHQHLAREMKVSLKGLKNVCRRKGLISFRFLYHLRELSAQRARKTLHSQLAEPLVNWCVLKGKKTTLPIRERRFCDLPGSSATRSLSNLTLAIRWVLSRATASVRVCLFRVPGLQAS